MVKIGFYFNVKFDFYDVVIVGVGLFGLVVVVYGGLEGLKILFIEWWVLGG